MPRWPWKRNKQPIVDVQIPPEVEEYYQSTQKDRRGIAWLLAFATLVLTILIAGALFFAGRWAYEVIAGNNDQPSEVPQDADDKVSNEQDQEGAGSDTVLPGDEVEQNQETLPSGPSSEDQSELDEEGATGPNSNNQTPTTGPGDLEIPRTGPTSDE